MFEKRCTSKSATVAVFFRFSTNTQPVEVLQTDGLTLSALRLNKIALAHHLPRETFIFYKKGSL